MEGHSGANLIQCINAQDDSFVNKCYIKMITGDQIRMARAALRLGVRELGDLAGVAPLTVSRLENGRGAYVSTLTKIQRALEKAGVVFIDGDEPGIRLKKSSSLAAPSPRKRGKSKSK
jgi:transcriptional regulator with XRE-family HTH domain